MKATVLSDNIACGNIGGEWGLCIYIEYQGKKILLDTGSSDLFLKNAEKLGIGNLGGAKNVAGWFRSNASTLQEIMNVFICESRVAEGVRFSVLVRQDNVVLPVKKEPDKPEREQA